ncbi:MAG: hypothetical protein L3K08_07960, partial [Thermoplasmata archaeon]|nr:hypothetical protein [Thermoplasmata archaeon]
MDFGRAFGADRFAGRRTVARRLDLAFARFTGAGPWRSSRTALFGVDGLCSVDQTISPARTGTGRSFSAGGKPHSYASVYAQYGLNA